MATTRARLVVTAIIFLAAICASAGFWFHTSTDNATVLRKYSPIYFIAASTVTVISFSSPLLFHLFCIRRRQAHAKRGDVRSIPYAKLATAGLATVLTLVPAEILAGKLYRHLQKVQRSETQYHPFLQAVPTPGDVELRINRWGFRGEELDIQKPPTTFRIFFLGGSTVYSKRVDFEDSHPRLLEKKLREENPHVQIEIQNAGMDWFTSQHSLIRFLSQVQDFEPDLIIVFHGVNDLCRSFSPPRFARGGYQIDYGHYLGATAQMVEAYYEVTPQPRLYLARMVREIFSRYWFSDFARTPVLPDTQVFDWPSLSQFQRNMRELVSLIKSKDIGVLVASQPFLYKSGMTEGEKGALWFSEGLCHDGSRKPDIESMIRGMIAFNDASRRIAEEANVVFVDLEEAIPKTLRFFLDDVHFTEEGNSVVCDAFSGAITEKKLITKRYPTPN